MRIVNGYAVCAGDCPMFQRIKGMGKGTCAMAEGKSCAVGQLCFFPIQSGGTRYPFGRFGTGKKYRVIGATPKPQRKLKVA